MIHLWMNAVHANAIFPSKLAKCLVFSNLDKYVYQEKRQQLLTEIRTLCEAPCYQGLVEFYGAFYTPDSGQISIALEYMDGGSLADIIRVRKQIPEAVLSLMVKKLLHVSILPSVPLVSSFIICAVYSSSIMCTLY